MKMIQNQSLYWAGSPGAVYSALARLVDKKLIERLDGEEPSIYKTTAAGRRALLAYAGIPVPARKLIVDPSLVRAKLRILYEFSAADRLVFYERQLVEYPKAKQLVLDKRTGNLGRPISQELSDLALTQLEMEHQFILGLKKQELLAKANHKPRS